MIAFNDPEAVGMVSAWKCANLEIEICEDRWLFGQMCSGGKLIRLLLLSAIALQSHPAASVTLSSSTIRRVIVSKRGVYEYKESNRRACAWERGKDRYRFPQRGERAAQAFLRDKDARRVRRIQRVNDLEGRTLGVLGY